MTVRGMVFAALAAGFMAVVGLVLLAGPVKVADAQAGGIDCGSALAPDNAGPLVGAGQDELAVFNRLRAECTDRLDTQRAIAWPLLGIGVVGAGVATVLVVSRRRQVSERR